MVEQKRAPRGTAGVMLQMSSQRQAGAMRSVLRSSFLCGEKGGGLSPSLSQKLGSAFTPPSRSLMKMLNSTGPSIAPLVKSFLV